MHDAPLQHRAADPTGLVRAHRSHVGFRALCRREVVRMTKIWSQTIGAPVLTAMLNLGVFGWALGTRIGDVQGVGYLTYIVPGVVLMQVVTQAYANNSSSVFQGRSDRYIEDILAAPMHAWQVSLAILWGGLLRASIIAVLVVAGAALLTDVQLAHPGLAALIVVCTSVLWGSVGVIAGIVAQTFDQHTLVGNLVITPLVFVGGVFYSVDMLPERLAWLTRLDPLFYQVNAMRHAFLGDSDTSFAFALGLTVALAVVCFVAQVALFLTGYRLKD